MSQLSRHAVAGLALACCALGWSAPGMAHDDGGSRRQCDVRSLRGTYLFTATGFFIPPGAPAAVPKAIMEVLKFTGDGVVTTPGITLSRNGIVDVIDQGSNGTYTLKSDCRGTVTFADGPMFNIYVSRREDELWMMQTAPFSPTFQGKATRVDPDSDWR
ncbi:hypothetical protein WKW79_11160 [Variovorax robiniae]|uniref:Uncharacterized protein n=1 Tax=Variovorax robiniae TaxID=1836199 RepID=A0ABU8X5N8_9BURK